jgi:glycosyltransferase involved in cell wall biosynthesis
VNDAFKVLQVTAIDVTVKKLLLPLIDRLTEESYQVHVACSDGPYVAELKTQGYHIHAIPIARRINPLSNLRSLWRLYRLIRKERFDVVHVHTMIASVIGRLAARMAGVSVVIYTAHGFYFHENMPWWKRRLTVWIEKAFGLLTDLIFTQSREDAEAAVREGIRPAAKVAWIGNGVNTRRFTPARPPEVLSERYGLAPADKVVGFVGRFVREKGILELIEAMKIVNRSIPEARLLLVGDTLVSDRDRQIKEIISQLREQDPRLPGGLHRLHRRYRRPDVGHGYLRAALAPEGMPRTIIEAMASGKPVVATDIRGCREEVVPGETGLIVPVNNAPALAEAITNILADPATGRRMGAAGRARAQEHFDERSVLDKQMESYTDIVKKKHIPRTSLQAQLENKKVRLAVKRLVDIGLSLVSLIFLLPLFLLIGVLIKIDSKGPVFFRQERAGGTASHS